MSMAIRVAPPKTLGIYCKTASIVGRGIFIDHWMVVLR
ncbi:hypothetical protein NOC27_796 [Nitrosococcus oceani AFC27]|nr:hypothetical protein NOC27_796 [Nitrosococcus oceani AFC27]